VEYFIKVRQRSLMNFQRRTDKFYRDKVEAVRSTTSTTPTHDVTHKSTPTINECVEVIAADEVEKLID